MNTMYRLIMDSRETGTLKRRAVVRRQLDKRQAAVLNAAFQLVGLTDRYVKERAK